MRRSILTLADALLRALGPLWLRYCDWRSRRGVRRHGPASRNGDLGIDSLEARFYWADFADYADDSLLAAALPGRELSPEQKADRAREKALVSAYKTGRVVTAKWDPAIQDYRLDGIPAADYQVPDR